MDYAMAGGQTLIYYINAYTTLISAVLGVCFSIGAVIAERETNRTNALYMLARSLALACAAAIPVCKNAPTILFVITAAMLIVQMVDCIIGIIIKSKIRTIGPFIMAVISKDEYFERKINWPASSSTVGEKGNDNKNNICICKWWNYYCWV